MPSAETPLEKFWQRCQCILGLPGFSKSNVVQGQVNWLIHEDDQTDFLPFHTEFLVIITVFMVLSLTGNKITKFQNLLVYF